MRRVALPALGTVSYGDVMRTLLTATLSVCLMFGLVGCDDAESAPGTITVSLDGLEGFEGLAVDAWVLPMEPAQEKQALGGTRLGVINGDPYSGSDVMHPQDVERYWDVVAGEIATFQPGTYRFIIEAYVPSGRMRHGCEMSVQVVEGEPLVVTISSLPTYTDDGFHWKPDDQLLYPDCPN